jgi:hypothetical protein
MMEIYQHAIEQKYRLLSYGDAMLLNKQTKNATLCFCPHIGSGK